MPTTTPDNIYYADTSTPASMVSISSAEATSVQVALTSRFATAQFKQWKWTNAAARTAQTGMTKGDLGLQLDTNAYYWYSGTAWVQQSRIHAEYNHSTSVPNSAVTNMAAPTLDSSYSSAAAATYFTPVATGLTLLLPGDYNFSATYVLPAAVTATRAFTDITAGLFSGRFSYMAGEASWVASGSFRTTAASTVNPHVLFQASGATRLITGRLVIDYLGMAV